SYAFEEHLVGGEEKPEVKIYPHHVSYKLSGSWPGKKPEVREAYNPGMFSWGGQNFRAGICKV
ncbi:hypothetical protein, partial [Candidatus Hakubella thermalkaliphila]|uniref:hypothetical protein n=1 Tax=Candidatus Hakubella thermalkaliphila TaxID=2754717 RepID=UPI0015947124